MSRRPLLIAGRRTAALAAVIATAGVAACDSAASDTGVLAIEHYLAPCVAVGPTFCLVATDVDTGDRQLLYDGIEGFSHAWGIRYQVRVTTREIADPPQDGSSLRLVVDEVVAREPVTSDTRFTLAFPGDAPASDEDGFVVGTPPRSIRLAAGPRVACASDELCQELWDRVRSGAPAEVDFRHGATLGGSVIAIDVR